MKSRAPEILRTLLTVMRKELRDIFRDRRTLLLALGLSPLLTPILIIGLGTLGESRARSQIEKPLELPVVGREHAPNLIAWLEGQNVVIKAPPKDIDAAIANQEEDVILRIGADFPRAMAQEPAGAAGNHPGQHPPGCADPGHSACRPCSRPMVDRPVRCACWRAASAPARPPRSRSGKPTWPRPRRNADGCCPSSFPTS